MAENHKTLVCGDLHTKTKILEEIIKKSENFDKIIFLGDYVDEWDTPAIYSAELLTKLIEFKKANFEKVVLILGNHDLSEWQGFDFKCSGYNALTHEAVYSLYQDNESLFRVAYAQDDILFTHAGLVSQWCKDLDIPANLSTKEYADILNLALTERYEDRKSFKALAQAGPARGGWHAPSPLWTDETELLRDAMPINQIVGHTPQKSVQIVGKNEHRLAFCDTFSMYSDYAPIGDQSMLEIFNKEWRKMSLCEN